MVTVLLDAPAFLQEVPTNEPRRRSRYVDHRTNVGERSPLKACSLIQYLTMVCENG